jgi:hypothetical protein
VGSANFEWIVREVADLAIAKARTVPHLPELRWSTFLSGHMFKAKAAKKNHASKRAAKVVQTVTKKNSKLAEDEEATTAEAEPMGSVAAAVPRDEGSSAKQRQKAKPPKPADKNAKAKPVRPSK